MYVIWVIFLYFETLFRSGVIQPSRIGEDGRPEPIEHVLQLTESSQQSTETREEDSD